MYVYFYPKYHSATKKKKKITGEQIFSHQNISKDHIKMACHKEAAGKRPKNKSENTKAGNALEPIYFLKQ